MVQPGKIAVELSLMLDQFNKAILDANAKLTGMGKEFDQVAARMSRTAEGLGKAGSTLSKYLTLPILGIGLAAMDHAAKYANERVQFNQKISNFQAIQWMIADSYTELEAARLLLMNAAFRKEQGRPYAKEASMAKMYATESANRACYNALQMLGGYGYTQDFPIERYARDARITTIYEGTSEIQRLIISHEILRGLAA